MDYNLSNELLTKVVGDYKPKPPSCDYQQHISYENNENGRVRLSRETEENGMPFFIPEKVPNDDKTNYFNAMKHTLQNTQLSSLFFSLENINIIQNAIRAGVYELSNKKYIIDRQDSDNLKIVMRSIYLQYSLHRQDNIREQIETLNKLVTDYCIPKIHSEVIGYMKYKTDISTLAKPMDHPVHLHQDKTVELNRFL